MKINNRVDKKITKHDKKTTKGYNTNVKEIIMKDGVAAGTKSAEYVKTK